MERGRLHRRTPQCDRPVHVSATTVTGMRFVDERGRSVSHVSFHRAGATMLNRRLDDSVCVTNRREKCRLHQGAVVRWAHSRAARKSLHRAKLRFNGRTHIQPCLPKTGCKEIDPRFWAVPLNASLWNQFRTQPRHGSDRRQGTGRSQSACPFIPFAARQCPANRRGLSPGTDNEGTTAPGRERCALS